MRGSGRKGRKKGNWAQEHNPNVPEATRIRITQLLEEFRTGEDEVYTFDASLTNSERAVVHELCKTMSLVSKSSGRDNQRRVSIRKRKKKHVKLMKGEKDITCFLTFSKETQEVLQDLFTHYPPRDEKINEEMIGNHSRNTAKIKGKKDDCFCKPSMNKVEITKKEESLASRLTKSSSLRQIAEEKSKLPIASFRDVITSTINSHQMSLANDLLITQTLIMQYAIFFATVKVVLISGETGCGKTTQVPQFLLDYMWDKGEACKIVCTQPRRISATSVAERISYERGENVGSTVGYKIRLESKGGKHSSIMFCTNGILLRVLVGKGTGTPIKEASNEIPKDDVFEATHVIVDEIHERDRFSDLMLAILREMLPSYPHLRLILMSATIDAERLSQYFGGCPIIRVPGFTYPVKTLYLEDVLSILESTEDNHLDSASLSDTVEDTELTEEYRVALDEAINLAWSIDEFDLLLELVSSEESPKVFNYQHSLTGASPLMVFAGKGRVGDVCMLISFGADCHLRAKDGTTALEWAAQENQGEVAEIIKKRMEIVISNLGEEQLLLDKYIANINPELVDIVLIARLLRKICTDSKEGAILVFLPGWDDINKTREKLLASPLFKDSSKFLIISLHSMVPSVEQKNVFKRPPPGSRKIILSTNIAETAVTIDDVVYVIDSGRMKEKNYDPYNNVSTLYSSWVSLASAKQREGRAGRCQSGICYHLYSKTRAASLPHFQVPEIKRMPIEELCLQVKLLDPNCKIVDFLQKTLDPPVAQTIHNAIVLLQEIGALSLDETLTELGEKLASLPVHPSTSKMLLFSILMNCLDPALTLACASDYKDPFILSMAPEEKKRAADAKAELASLYGGHSDQVMVIAAFECWRRAKDKGQEAYFCSQYFVSSSTMRMLCGLRKQLQSELIRHGFIPEDGSSCSLNAQDPGILHAVLVSGLYPMVGRLQPKGKRALVETPSSAKVLLHPQSSNSKLPVNKSNSLPLVIHDEITRGDRGIYIRNSTVVGPYPLLLLAKEMVVAPAKDNKDEESDGDVDASASDEDGMEMHTSSGGQCGEQILSCPDNTVSIVVDRWIKFESTALDAAWIYCLRERLSAAILFKVKHPWKVLPPALEASVNAIAHILSYDGQSGISLPVESVDSPSSMSNANEIDTSTPGKRKRKSLNSNDFLKSLMSNDSPHFRKSRTLISNDTHLNEMPGDNRPPPFTSVHRNPYQMTPTQVPGLAGYGLTRNGPYGPWEHTFRRQ